MRLQKMHGCHLRGFANCGMQYESENSLSGVGISHFLGKSREISYQNGERFNQDIITMVKRYQGKWTSCMLTDYCWTLKRDVPDAKYRRKVISLFILEERFCLFHEHVMYYTAHLKSSVFFNPSLI